MVALRQRAAWVGILSFFLGLYGLTFHGYVDVEDSEVCYQAVSSFLDNGTLTIGETENGQRLIDAGFYVARGADGAHYPIYPLPQLLLQLPGTFVGRVLSGFANEQPDEVVRLAFSSINILAGALLAVIIYLLGRQLGQSPRIAAVSALLGGSCTMLWAYAQSTFVDSQLALFTSAAVLCLFSARLPPQGRLLQAAHLLLLAGLLHGLACQIRPLAILLLLPNALFAWRGGVRALGLFLLPVVAIAAGTTWLDSEVFGRPADIGLAGQLADQAPVLTFSYTLALLGLLFSDGRGLFMLSPILLLALLAWPSLRRKQPACAWVIAGHLMVPTLFLAAFDGWHGGWCWGPRYLLPAVPLLAALSGCWLQHRHALARTLAVVLITASLGIQVLSVAVPHRIYMVAATSSGSHVDQFFYYSRFSPVLVHGRILAHKLHQDDDVYTLRGLFDIADDKPLAVTEYPRPQIDGYSRGFSHFAWLRVFDKGHGLVAYSALALCITLMVGGLWLTLRSTRSLPQPADDSGPPLGNDRDVGIDRPVADP